MHKISLKSILLLVSLSISAGLTFAHNSQTVATTVKLSELSSQSLQAKKANNDLATKNLQQHKSLNAKTNGIKLSSQQLVGTWSVTSVNSSGEKTTNTILYSPDGTYLHLKTLNNGDWWVVTTGTWKLAGNILYENTEAGENLEGPVKFRSNDEFVYISDNGETKWQRVDINPNLSKDQLIGTWSIVVQQRVGNFFIDNSFERSNSKLIELNSDGTFRYKNIDAGIIGLSDIITKSASGTWTYVNSGYADGLLLLKDSQGNLFSFSSINWNEDGNFININRSDYDRDQNKYDPGIIEEFRRSDLIIDEWG